MKAKTESKKNEDILVWKNKYLRALADYQNLERRVIEDSVAVKKYAAKEVILKFLPLIDDLIKAQFQIKNTGLKYIIDKFDTVLKNEYVERRSTLNQKFNSEFMECVSIVEGNKDNEVIEEVRPAYFMNGQVIRTAQVIVSRTKTKEKKEEKIENKSVS